MTGASRTAARSRARPCPSECPHPTSARHTTSTTTARARWAERVLKVAQASERSRGWPARPCQGRGMVPGFPRRRQDGPAPGPAATDDVVHLDDDDHAWWARRDI